MKADHAVEAISRFFNDLIGSLIPGAVLVVGLALMHLGPTKIVEASKSMEGAVVVLSAIGIMFAAGHALLAIFELALQPLLQACRLATGFDEAAAKKRQAYNLFADVIDKLQIGDAPQASAEWAYNELHSAALSVSAEGALVARRFMFISLLCNGVGTALVIMMVDFLSCLALNKLLLFPYAMAANWIVQSVLMLFIAASLFKRGEVFFRRAMTTAFSIAVVELKLKRESSGEM